MPNKELQGGLFNSTKGEKRRHFFDLLSKERVRLTNLIIPDSYVFRTAEDNAVTRTAITEGNPYIPKE